jgi:hypothetical protein
VRRVESLSVVVFVVWLKWRVTVPVHVPLDGFGSDVEAGVPPVGDGVPPTGAVAPGAGLPAHPAARRTARNPAAGTLIEVVKAEPSCFGPAPRGRGVWVPYATE